MSAQVIDMPGANRAENAETNSAPVDVGVKPPKRPLRPSLGLLLASLITIAAGFPHLAMILILGAMIAVWNDD